METVRSKWTDERLDDFLAEFHDFRTETRSEFVALRAEINARFDSLNARFDSRFDSLNRTMIGIFGSIVVGFLVTNL
jgi:hypothetical protein